MTTELKRFTDAYATMTIAAYQPLILRWVSTTALRFIAASVVKRLPKAKTMKYTPKIPAAIALASRIPIAEASAVAEEPARRERSSRLARSVPIIISGLLGRRPSGINYSEAREDLLRSLLKSGKEWAENPDQRDLLQLMTEGMKVQGVHLPHLWPASINIEEALSPIGIAHFYRQLYFNKEEGVGPIEEAFTIAPFETLEVVYQTARRQIHEDILEQGLEEVSESAVEEKNLEEVSDKVSSLMQQDVSASMSATGSGTVGVWQVGASASASFGISSERGRDYSTRRLKDVTRRAAERITKSFTIKSRDVTELTTTSTTRRVINNQTGAPVSYGLRRVLRRVSVKVQNLGPRLVWQLYVRNPGEGLALSRFVNFRESDAIAAPDIPPGVPPRPSGGTETESATVSVQQDAAKTDYIEIVVKPGSDRVVTGLRIDGLTDVDGGGKEDDSPAPDNSFDLGSPGWADAQQTFTAKIRVVVENSKTLQATYTYTWKPSQAVIAGWETLRQDALAKITEEALVRQFEQRRQLITEKSRIKARPANDLRREERYEVMNRMVSHLFGRSDDASEPTPLEIEYFHRFFDIDAIFITTHPSWWRPRFAAKDIGWQREAYEVTAESDPAPLGSSLGWLIQVDGDRRRNEFLNSPWTRVCVPIRASRERDAIEWLARHLEGEIGYDITSGPLRDLLTEIEDYRAREAELGVNGADYVTVSSTAGAPADPLEPEGVYPVVDEFEVTMPTDGFVYDELNVTIP